MRAPWIAGAIIFGTAIYVLFVLYPARNIAKMDPVKALRYEWKAESDFAF